MTYQDYVDQPRTLEAALECIRRLTVERDKTSRAYWDAREDVSRLTLQRDRLTAANMELREELSSMAMDQLGDLGQAMERDADLERAQGLAVDFEQRLAEVFRLLTESGHPAGRIRKAIEVLQAGDPEPEPLPVSYYGGLIPDFTGGVDAAEYVRRQREGVDTNPDLRYVGRYCWRCEGLVTDSCQSDNVPIYVDAEWADDMKTEIARLEEKGQT